MAEQVKPKRIKVTLHCGPEKVNMSLACKYNAQQKMARVLKKIRSEWPNPFKDTAIEFDLNVGGKEVKIDDVASFDTALCNSKPNASNFVEVRVQQIQFTTDKAYKAITVNYGKHQMDIDDLIAKDESQWPNTLVDDIKTRVKEYFNLTSAFKIQTKDEDIDIDNNDDLEAELMDGDITAYKAIVLTDNLPMPQLRKPTYQIKGSRDYEEKDGALVPTYRSADETSLTDEQKKNLPNMLAKILGDDFLDKITTLPDLMDGIDKILDERPWDPANIDEEVVQMMLYIIKNAAPNYSGDFFETMSLNIGGPKWIYNAEKGYGKVYTHQSDKIKAGIYRWDVGCIAPLHDHGPETVAFYVGMGKRSRLLNKVYEKIETSGTYTMAAKNNPGTINVRKEYDEILDASTSRVGVLRAHHAHAVQNLSQYPSYTLHVYVPSYDFGLVWSYEHRMSVDHIRMTWMRVGTVFLKDVMKEPEELSEQKSDSVSVSGSLTEPQMWVARQATIYEH